VRVIETGSGASDAVELKAVIAAQRTGLPIMVTRDDEEGQRVFVLEPEDERLWVGRGAACDLRLDWDKQASRCHAELLRVAGGWAVVDDGLSRNGTFVGGERVAGRRRLHHGEVVRVGSSSMTYRLAVPSGSATRPHEDMLAMPDLTPTQRKVLVSLCRPLLDSRGPAVPATNPAIAAELHLSTKAIKTHMRTLFAKFGVESLPQNQKRTRLAKLAMQAGLASELRHAPGAATGGRPGT